MRDVSLESTRWTSWTKAVPGSQYPSLRSPKVFSCEPVWGVLVGVRDGCMTLGAGPELYRVDAGAVSARGHRLGPEELDPAARERIRELTSDRPGRDRIREILLLADLTGFSSAGAAELLRDDVRSEEWRVGEALAEAYLLDNHRCLFPWRSRWDLRNPRGVPPGADLVGFYEDGQESRFAFGEVKTSAQGDHPSVMRGEGGLPAQIIDLRDRADLRRWLVQYLTLRAQGQPWWDRFKAALTAFFRNPRDFVIFGVLVREAAPNPTDLANCATKVADGCPTETRIHLRGLYLPPGFLKSFLSPLGGAAA